jgi:bifunctional DNA-binding transcriptional regulator/antitoxin component of YhaV-PrlF toxin-antitoxin module
VPVEFRKMLGIDANDQLEMRVEGERLILLKITPACVLCAADADLIAVADRFVCNDCAGKIRRAPECALCQQVDGLREAHGKFLCANCVDEFVHV